MYICTSFRCLLTVLFLLAGAFHPQLRRQHLVNVALAKTSILRSSPFLMKETKHELIGEPIENGGGGGNGGRVAHGRITHNWWIWMNYGSKANSKDEKVWIHLQGNAVFRPRNGISISDTIAHEVWNISGWRHSQNHKQRQPRDCGTVRGYKNRKSALKNSAIKKPCYATSSIIHFLSVKHFSKGLVK